MSRSAAATVAPRHLQREAPVLAALMAAPDDDLPESEDERAAVQAAKASRRMKPHAAIAAELEERRKSA